MRVRQAELLRQCRADRGVVVGLEPRRERHKLRTRMTALGEVLGLTGLPRLPTLLRLAAGASSFRRTGSLVRGLRGAALAAGRLATLRASFAAGRFLVCHRL